MNWNTASYSEALPLEAYLSAYANGTDIAAAVAQEALDYDNPKTFFEDLAQYGCVSGMVGSLIYYHETHKFFDQHYHEIEDIRLQVQEDVGLVLDVQGDLKNHLTWMAFEHRARQLYSAWHYE